MSQLFAHPDLPRNSQTPRLWPRILGVFLVFIGLALFLALASYDWRDVSAQCAPAQSPPKNLVGYAGAWFAYLSTLLLGFAAWTLPVWVAFAGVRLVLARRLGWRFLGMFLATVAVVGLSAQAGLSMPSFTELYGPQRLNNGGFPGGVLGDLMVANLAPAIGGGATCCILLAVLLFGAVLIVGLRDVADGIFARNEEPPKERPAVDVQVASPETVPAEESRPLTREEIRARKAAEREAEKQRKAAEKEAERQRKEAERQAAKEAKLFAKQQAEEAKAAEKAAAEEARQQEMKRRTEEFLEKQRKEAEAARASTAAVTVEQPDPSADSAAHADRRSGPGDSPVHADRRSGPGDSPVHADRRSGPGGTPEPSAVPEPEPEADSDFPSPGEEAPPHIDYTLPTIDHLSVPPPKVEDTGEFAEKCGKTIVETLGEFGITVSLVGVHRGPVITQFHLMPAPGVRINKVTGYATDLQRALSAQQVRILAPIPGKSVIGVEVPNAKADIVAIREIAEGETWRARVAKSPLPLLLGKDIGGADYACDLASMPHLLIAGATGAGKSACINSLLAGLLLTRTPDELRLIMVDPKFVEFTPYAEIPHLLVPIITEPKKVGVALQWAIGEMNRRLKLFARGGARNIADYNRNPIQGELFGSQLAGPDGKLPYVVIVIDELADLMLTSKNEIEGRISNLAAKARAAGIHMIIATQRPSVNVVTGVIKANFPGRIAFKVASNVDSMTILDVHGAESLLGRGDMLVHDPRVMGNTRVQGCWVSDEEVAAITNDLRAQGRPAYVSSIKNKLDAIKVEEDEDGDDFDDSGDSDSPSRGDRRPAGASEPSAGDIDPNDDEALLRKALEIFRENRRASTSSLQRRLGLGYNRAARVLDKLQERGYIGPATSNNAPREILVDLDEVLGTGDEGDEG